MVQGQPPAYSVAAAGQPGAVVYACATACSSAYGLSIAEPGLFRRSPSTASACSICERASRSAERLPPVCVLLASNAGTFPFVDRAGIVRCCRGCRGRCMPAGWFAPPRRCWRCGDLLSYCDGRASPRSWASQPTLLGSAGGAYGAGARRCGGRRPLAVGWDRHTRRAALALLIMAGCPYARCCIVADVLPRDGDGQVTARVAPGARPSGCAGDGRAPPSLLAETDALTGGAQPARLVPGG